MTDSRPSDDEFEPYEEDRGIPLPVFWIAIALALWGIVMLYHNNRSVMIGRSERSEAAKPQSRDVGAGALASSSRGARPVTSPTDQALPAPFRHSLLHLF